MGRRNRDGERGKLKQQQQLKDRGQAGMKRRRKRLSERKKNEIERGKRKCISRKILKPWMWEETIFTLLLWYMAARVSFPYSQLTGALLLVEKTRLARELGSKAVTSTNICCRGRR